MIAIEDFRLDPSSMQLLFTVGTLSGPVACTCDVWGMFRYLEQTDRIAVANRATNSVLFRFDGSSHSGRSAYMCTAVHVIEDYLLAYAREQEIGAVSQQAINSVGRLCKTLGSLEEACKLMSFRSDGRWLEWIRRQVEAEKFCF